MLLSSQRLDDYQHPRCRLVRPGFFWSWNRKKGWKLVSKTWRCLFFFLLWPGLLVWTSSQAHIFHITSCVHVGFWSFDGYEFGVYHSGGAGATHWVKFIDKVYNSLVLVVGRPGGSKKVIKIVLKGTLFPRYTVLCLLKMPSLSQKKMSEWWVIDDCLILVTLQSHLCQVLKGKEDEGVLPAFCWPTRYLVFHKSFFSRAYPGHWVLRAVLGCLTTRAEDMQAISLLTPPTICHWFAPFHRSQLWVFNKKRMGEG